MKDRRRYLREGIFEAWTDHFFRVERSITCVKVGLRRGVEVKDREECRSILRYGREDYAEIERLAVADAWRIGGLVLNRDQILSAKLDAYYDIVGGRRVKVKVFCITINEYLKVCVKPHYHSFIPPMIRVFFNAIIFAKTFAKGVDFRDNSYEYIHRNFVDPTLEGFDKFLEVNRRAVDYLKRGLKQWVGDLWEKFFGVREDLTVKVSQVELAFDSYIDKLKALNGLRLIAGKSKTLKYDYEPSSEVWKDYGFGLKYYVTIRKGFQVKVYTKAVHKASGRALTRFEVTTNVGRYVEEFSRNELIKMISDVVEVLNLGIVDREAEEKVKEILRPFVRCRKRELEDLHYAFLLDLFLHGEVRGSGVYRSVAEVYKGIGLVEVRGRGRYSRYVLSPKYYAVSEALRKAFSGLVDHVLGPKQ